MAVSDAVAIISEVLADESTDLYDLVEGRVYSPDAPRNFGNQEPTIIFEVIQETPHIHNALSEVMIFFTCYGGSLNPDDAREVYLALMDTLNGRDLTVVESGSLLSAKQLGGYITDTDGDTEWPVSRATYLIRVSS